MDTLSRDVNVNPTMYIRYVRYANGVHLSELLENTALVQGIRFEPLG